MATDDENIPPVPPPPSGLPVPPPPPAPESITATNSEAETAPVKNSETVATRTETSYAAPFTTAPTTPTPTTPAPTTPAPTTPAPIADKASRKTNKKWIVTASIILLVALALIISYKVIGGRFSPAKTAEGYLSAIVDGKASKALKFYDPNYRSGERILLNDEIYNKATNRPSDFHIITISEEQSNEKNGNTVIVQAELISDMKKYPVTLTLREEGKKYGIFSNWTISDAPLNTIEIESPTPNLNINGVDVDLSVSTEKNDSDASFANQYYSLPAFPGTYSINAQSKEKLIKLEGNEKVTVPIIGGNSTFYVKATFTEEVQKQAQTQIKAHFDKCLAATTFEVKECPELEMSDPGYKAVTNIKRSWDKEPAVKIEKKPQFSDGKYMGWANVQAKVLIKYQERSTDKDPWKDTKNPYKNSINSRFKFTIEAGKVKVNFQKDTTTDGFF